MVDNCTYNKTKILHELTRILGFIEKYGKKDARSAKHHKCHHLLDRLHADLQRHTHQLVQELQRAKL